MNENRIVNLLNRVIGSKGIKLKKAGEYMYWSPFISHHKPKLQINIETEKWHCWVSNSGGRKLFQLLKKIRAPKEYYNELEELVGDFPKYSNDVKNTVVKSLQLPKEFKPLWNGGNSIIKRHTLNYLNKRNITYEDIINIILVIVIQGYIQIVLLYLRIIQKVNLIFLLVGISIIVK